MFLTFTISYRQDRLIILGTECERNFLIKISADKRSCCIKSSAHAIIVDASGEVTMVLPSTFQVHLDYYNQFE
jgi:hypothetical protein